MCGQIAVPCLVGIPARSCSFRSTPANRSLNNLATGGIASSDLMKSTASVCSKDRFSDVLFMVSILHKTGTQVKNYHSSD